MLARSKLGPIRAITVTAVDLDRVERGYATVLDYTRLERRPVTPAEAASWGALAAAGRDMLVLRPASGASTELRFVQWAAPSDYRPFSTWGWNALEIVVRDVDALAERIALTEDFVLATEPHGIDTFPYLCACQATGPAGEYINFTRINPPRPDLPVAESFVDRCFIVTLGVPNIESALRFYADRFTNATGDVRKVRLRMMNRLCGLDEETKHSLSTVVLAEGTKLELDQSPPQAKARSRAHAGLPWGIGIVSVNCTALAPHLSEALGPVHVVGSEQRLTIEGPGGGRLELIECRAPAT